MIFHVAWVIQGCFGEDVVVGMCSLIASWAACCKMFHCECGVGGSGS